eukprot:g2801.t1
MAAEARVLARRRAQQAQREAALQQQHNEEKERERALIAEIELLEQMAREAESENSDGEGGREGGAENTGGDVDNKTTECAAEEAAGSASDVNDVNEASPDSRFAAADMLESTPTVRLPSWRLAEIERDIADAEDAARAQCSDGDESADEVKSDGGMSSDDPPPPSATRKRKAPKWSRRKAQLEALEKEHLRSHRAATHARRGSAASAASMATGAKAGAEAGAEAGTEASTELRLQGERARRLERRERARQQRLQRRRQQRVQGAAAKAAPPSPAKHRAPSPVPPTAGATGAAIDGTRTLQEWLVSIGVPEAEASQYDITLSARGFDDVSALQDLPPDDAAARTELRGFGLKEGHIRKPLSESELQERSFGIGLPDIFQRPESQGVVGNEAVVERLRAFCCSHAGRSAVVWGPPGAGSGSALRAFVQHHIADQRRRATARAQRKKVWKVGHEGGKMVRRLSADSDGDDDTGVEDWSFGLVYHAADASAHARRPEQLLQNLCEQLIARFELTGDGGIGSGAGGGEPHDRGAATLPLRDTTARALRVLFPRLLERAARRTRTLVGVAKEVVPTPAEAVKEDAGAAPPAPAAAAGREVEIEIETEIEAESEAESEAAVASDAAADIKAKCMAEGAAGTVIDPEAKNEGLSASEAGGTSESDGSADQAEARARARARAWAQAHARARAFDNQLLHAVLSMEHSHEPLYLRLLCAALRSRPDTSWLALYARRQLDGDRASIATAAPPAVTAEAVAAVPTKARWSALVRFLSCGAACSARGLIRQALARAEAGPEVAGGTESGSGASVSAEAAQVFGAGSTTSALHPAARGAAFWRAELLLCALAVGRGGDGMLARELEALYTNCAAEWQRSVSRLEGGGESGSQDLAADAAGMTRRELRRRGSAQQNRLNVEELRRQRRTSAVVGTHVGTATAQVDAMRRRMTGARGGVRARAANGNKGAGVDAGVDGRDADGVAESGLTHVQWLLRLVYDCGLAVRKADGLWVLSTAVVADEVCRRYGVVQPGASAATTSATGGTTQEQCAFETGTSSDSQERDKRSRKPQHENTNGDGSSVDSSSDSGSDSQAESGSSGSGSGYDSGSALPMPCPPARAQRPTAATSSTCAAPKARVLHELLAGFFVGEWLRHVGFARCTKLRQPPEARAYQSLESRLRAQAGGGGDNGLHAPKGADTGVGEVLRGRRGAAAEAALGAALLLAGSLHAFGDEGPDAELSVACVLRATAAEWVTSATVSALELSAGGLPPRVMLDVVCETARQWADALRSRRGDSEGDDEHTLSLPSSASRATDARALLRMPSGLRSALCLFWNEILSFACVPLTKQLLFFGEVEGDGGKEGVGDGEGDDIDVVGAGHGVAELTEIARRSSAAWSRRTAWPPLVRWAVASRSFGTALHNRYGERLIMGGGEGEGDAGNGDSDGGGEGEGADDAEKQSNASTDTGIGASADGRQRLTVSLQATLLGWLERAAHAKSLRNTTRGRDDWHSRELKHIDALGRPHETVSNLLQHVAEAAGGTGLEALVADGADDDEEGTRPGTSAEPGTAHEVGGVVRWLRLFHMLGYPDSALAVVRTRFAPLAAAISRALEGATPSVIRSVGDIIAHEEEEVENTGSAEAGGLDGESVLRMVLEAAAMEVDGDADEYRGAVLDHKSNADLLVQLRRFGAAEGQLFCYLTHSRPFSRVGVIDIDLLLGRKAQPPPQQQQQHGHGHGSTMPARARGMSATQGGLWASVSFDEQAGIMLNMRGKRVTAFEAGVLAHYLPSNQRLRHAAGGRKGTGGHAAVVTGLDLRDNPGMGVDGLRALAEACMRCPAITAVTVDRAGPLPVGKLRGDTGEQEGRALGGGSEQAMLDLSAHDLDPQEIRFMAVLMRANTLLRGVWLGGVAMAFARSSVDAAREREARRLRKIVRTAGWDQHQQQGAPALEGGAGPGQLNDVVAPEQRHDGGRSNVPCMPGPLPVQWIKGERGVGAPKLLDFSGGGLGMQEAVLVGELLHSNRLLTALNLARNELDADAVDALAGPLAQLAMLTSLDLSDNGLGPHAASPLAFLLSQRGPPFLRKLLLTGNPFGSQARAALGAALLGGAAADATGSDNCSIQAKKKPAPSSSDAAASREFLALDLDPGFGSLQLLERVATLELSGRQLGPADALLLAGVLRHSNQLTDVNLSANRLCGVWVEGGTQIGRFNPAPALQLMSAAAVSGRLRALAVGDNVVCGIALVGAAASAHERVREHDAWSARVSLAEDAARRFGTELRAPSTQLQESSSSSSGAAVGAGEYDVSLLRASLGAARSPQSALVHLDLSCNALFGVGRFGAGEMQPAAVATVCDFISGVRAALEGAVPTLTSLDVSNNLLGAHHGLALAQAVHVGGVAATAAAAAVATDTPGRAHRALQLRHLDARGCGIGMQAGAVLAEALSAVGDRANETLTTLNGLPVRAIRQGEVETIDLRAGVGVGTGSGADAGEIDSANPTSSPERSQSHASPTRRAPGLRQQALAHRPKPVARHADEADLHMLALLLTKFPGKLASITLTCSRSSAPAKPLLRKLCKQKGIALTI